MSITQGQYKPVNCLTSKLFTAASEFSMELVRNRCDVKIVYADPANIGHKTMRIEFSSAGVPSCVDLEVVKSDSGETVLVSQPDRKDATPIALDEVPLQSAALLVIRNIAATQTAKLS